MIKLVLEHLESREAVKGKIERKTRITRSDKSVAVFISDYKGAIRERLYGMGFGEEEIINIRPKTVSVFAHIDYREGGYLLEFVIKELLK